jgi:MYXO-CTERM domain-containing protein
MVSVAARAELSVSRAETEYAYNLSELKEAASVTVENVVLADYDGELNAYHKLKLGADVPDYNGRFDAKIAINQQAVAGVNADEGLTLAGGSTYKTDCGHISLMGGSLTLDTLTDNQLTFNTTLDEPYETLRGDVQLVLFSDVSSVKFIYGDITETAKEPGVYYTRADNFLTGCDYITFQTMLVYDSHAGVVYLQLKVPEPTTSTLGLLALTALCARRRRRG